MLRAVDVLSIAHHQSAGMELRSPHLRTASGLAPMSDAILNRSGQSPMTSVKDLGVSDMHPVIVHSVLERKSEMSCDTETDILDNPAMDRMTETEETEAFIRRTRMAREAKFKTQLPVYSYLEVRQSHYKHWETKRPMPRRFIPKFCTLCEVSMEWLLTGEGKGPQVEEIPAKVERRTSGRRRAKAA